jgi:mannitol/fructose-specific phosphotransferase system IIA component (Ntr-type)
MKLLGFLDSDHIIPELTAASREEAIEEMVGALISSGAMTEESRKVTVEAILEREHRGSTGIGGGIALPHLRETSFVKEVHGVFGRSSSGIAFGAVDGQPVYLFFLLVAPAGSDDYKSALTHLARVGRNSHFLRFLKEAGDTDEIIGVIEEMASESVD